ncbi:MAG: CRISPR-associated protein Cas4 [Clostridiales bacterium]|nr:CRISPR-associated protein Cas4 [Clostridiales bacterium]
MKEYKEEDFLQLAGLQHFTFCRRQWALIHIEQQWNENYRTMEGQIIHENVHDGTFNEKRKNVLITRAMPIVSRELGCSGECDVVEFHLNKDGINLFQHEGRFIPIPIEYKRGKPKENDSDILQLCAQAMCLEEMLVCEVTYGYLYYDEIRHRMKVEFTQEYRDKVRESFIQMHQLFERGHTPKVKRTKSCNACSLKDICLPRLNKESNVMQYFENVLRGENV